MERRVEAAGVETVGAERAVEVADSPLARVEHVQRPVGHREEVVVPGRDSVASGNVAGAFRGAAADGDDLGATGEPVRLRQVVALGDVAAADEGQFHHIRHQKVLTRS